MKRIFLKLQDRDFYKLSMDKTDQKQREKKGKKITWEKYFLDLMRFRKKLNSKEGKN